MKKRQPLLLFPLENSKDSWELLLQLLILLHQRCNILQKTLYLPYNYFRELFSSARKLQNWKQLWFLVLFYVFKGDYVCYLQYLLQTIQFLLLLLINIFLWLLLFRFTPFHPSVLPRLSLRCLCNLLILPLLHILTVHFHLRIRLHQFFQII